MRKHIFARFALVLAGVAFRSLAQLRSSDLGQHAPSTPISHSTGRSPCRLWECSGPQATLGTDMVEFLDTDGTVNGYVDCHGNIVGAGFNYQLECASPIPPPTSS